jgi:redox-sensitive bicupin YhaK (pirin superfamily)
MSFSNATEPVCSSCVEPAVETIIESRARDIGAFSVGRVLPSRARRMVGPFVFFDHMGPATLGPGKGMDVRPHPHIGIATVTYLFDGEIEHRDSLGFCQAIRPGAINWMTAGRGIVHSERTSAEKRADEMRLDGIQLWVALPKEHEETEPSFIHHPAATIPSFSVGGAEVRVLIGEGWGEKSPVATLHPTFYADVQLAAGSELKVPAYMPERAVYVASGQVSVGAQGLVERRMAVLSEGATVRLKAESASRVMLIGGEPLDGQRHIWWNFVSSSKERIERAKDDWQQGRFPLVPGDEDERLPLPK